MYFNFTGVALIILWYLNIHYGPIKRFLLSLAYTVQELK